MHLCALWNGWILRGKQEEHVQAGRRANGAAFAEYSEKLSGPINFYENSSLFWQSSLCSLRGGKKINALDSWWVINCK